MPLLVDASDFKAKSEHVELLVNVQTEIAGDHIGQDTESKTFPLVPKREGYLEGSFKAEKEIGTAFASPTGFSLLTMDMTYSAKSNRGYDYSSIQHEKPMSHPIKGTDHFLLKGFGQVQVTDIWAMHLRSVL